jgi:hypothetical protein
VNGDSTALRLQLARAGFTPLPLFGKEPPVYGKNNKRKGMADWQKLQSVTAEQIDMWARTWPDASNTGVLTRSMPTLDLDILNEDAARAVEDLVRERFEERGYFLVRIGKPPKRAFPFRTDEPFDKIVANITAANGSAEKIELLSDGQQLACFGVHPDTKQPYAWHGGEPGQIAREALPYIREDEARQLVDAVIGLLVRDFGYSHTQARPKAKKSNGADSGSGSADWRWLLDNIHEGRELHDSLRDLAAKMIRAGMHRGAVVNQLRALMLGSAAPHDDRWQDRYDDIPRLVDGADKFQTNDVSPSNELRTTAVGDLKMHGIDWLWPGRFARGKIGLIAGLPDYGKGQIAAFLAAVVTAGVELPCGEGTAAQGSVIWLNAEDDACDTVKPRLVAAGADCSRIAFVTGVHAGGKERAFSLVTDLYLLRKKIVETGNVVLVIIDPISAYLGIGKVDSRSATDVRGVLAPLKELAEELRVAVIGIAHFNKKDDIKSALLRVSDSIAYVASARSVYAVLDDPEDGNSKLFVKAKNNLAVDKKALRYGFSVKTVGYDKNLGKDIDAPFVVWHPQHVELTANEAMQAADGQSGYAKREARDFLRERLEVGPAKADDIIAEAEQNGITKRTLYRAKRDLGVKSRKTGLSAGWTWELSAQPKMATRDPQ